VPQERGRSELPEPAFGPSASYLVDQFPRAVPDHEVVGLDDDPSRRPEPLDPHGVMAVIGEAAVEPLALHFQRDAVRSMDQVDSPDPTVLIAEIDLRCHRTLASPDQHFVDPSLEPALRGPEAHRPFGGQFTHQCGTPKSSRAQIVDQAVQVRPGHQPTVVAGVEQPGNPLRMDLGSKVVHRANRRCDPYAVDLRDMTVVECSAGAHPAEWGPKCGVATGPNQLDRLRTKPGKVPECRGRLGRQRGVAADVEERRLSRRQRVIGHL
jgi:hypothetical protein